MCADSFFLIVLVSFDIFTFIGQTGCIFFLLFVFLSCVFFFNRTFPGDLQSRLHVSVFFTSGYNRLRLSKSTFCCCTVIDESVTTTSLAGVTHLTFVDVESD